MGIRDNIRSVIDNLGPARKLAGEFISSVQEEGFDLHAVIKPTAPQQQSASRSSAPKPAGEDTSKPTKPAPKKDGKAWYLDGQEDLDGWEDTNANEEKKAEARESAARHTQDAAQQQS